VHHPHPRQRCDGLPRLPLHQLAHRARGRRELDGEAHRSPTLGYLDVLHESQRHDIAPQVRVADAAQRVEDFVLGDGRHAILAAA